MSRDRIVVVGAGMGGLAAALSLASRGEEVLVVERAPAPGGKMRRLDVGGHAIDGGPTVFTMRWVLEQLFAEAGASLGEHVTLEPLAILARHAWSESERLDLHADLQHSADAIGAFSGAEEARRFLAFSAEAKRIYQTLEKPFLCAQRPNPVTLVSTTPAVGPAYGSVPAAASPTATNPLSVAVTADSPLTRSARPPGSEIRCQVTPSAENHIAARVVAVWNRFESQ